MQEIEKEEKMGLQKEAPKKSSTSNEKPVFSSFVHCCSSLARKSMPTDLKQAVCTLLHIYHQFSKCPEKSFYIKKYFTNENTNSKDISEFMLDIGKYKGRKDSTRLQQTVDKMKGEFVSLRQACAKTNCS